MIVGLSLSDNDDVSKADRSYRALREHPPRSESNPKVIDPLKSFKLPESKGNFRLWVEGVLLARSRSLVYRDHIDGRDATVSGSARLLTMCAITA